MTKLEELLQKLQQDGVSETQIAVILTELTKASSVKLYTQLVHALDEKERQLLDESSESSEDEANDVLEALYKKHYKISADEAVAALQEQFAANFLANYDAEAIKSQT